jgi:hypothetical protein
MLFGARRAGLQPATTGDQQNSKLTRTTFISTTTVRTARVLPARTAVLKKVNSIHKQPQIKLSHFLIYISATITRAAGPIV